MTARLRESRQRPTSITSGVVAMLAGIVAWSAVAGCSSPTEPEWRLELAWIVGNPLGDEPDLSLTVNGDRVELRILTAGGSDCYEREEVHQTIDHASRVVLAEPHNRYIVPLPGQACRDVIVGIEHQTVLGPLDAGDWLVRVRGLRVRDDNTVDTVEFDRPVEIAP
jgi:hypothetical protein